MSERSGGHVEHLTPSEQEAEKQTRRPEVSVEAAEHAQREQLEHAQKTVEHHAKSRHDTQVEGGNHRNEQPLYVNAELKRIALQRTLSRVRRHLSKPQKVLSKIVHQPAVQAASDLGAKTVARPSGLLAGGFCALVGSSFVLYLAKHYGFHYNYSTFFVFFVGGFAVGLLLELVIWLFSRRRRISS
jgi:hypothetical protein